MEKRNNYNLYIKFGVESPEYLGTMLNVTESEVNMWLLEEQENRFSGMQGLHGCPTQEELCDELGLDYDEDCWTDEDFEIFESAYCEAREDNFPTYSTVLTDEEKEEGIESETGEGIIYLY